MARTCLHLASALSQTRPKIQEIAGASGLTTCGRPENVKELEGEICKEATISLSSNASGKMMRRTRYQLSVGGGRYCACSYLTLLSLEDGEWGVEFR